MPAQAPRRIAIVTRYLPPQIDGVGDYSWQLAIALAEKKIPVSLITSAGSTPVFAPSPFLEVIPTIKNWGIFGLGSLTAAIRTSKATVINLQYVPHLYARHGINLGIVLLPLWTRLRLKKVVFTTCHELLSRRPLGIKSRLLQLIYLLQAWLILWGSSKVIVPVVWQENQLRRCFPRFSKRICRIPVGATIPIVMQTASTMSHPEKGAPLLPILGMFGTGPWWHHEMAMKILRGLLDQGLRVKLLFLGDIEGVNPHRFRKLRQQEAHLGLTGWVDWPGRLSPEEISRHLQQVDVFLALQSAGVTARSTALASALAHGLAVVATRGPDADLWLLQSGAVASIDPEDLPQTIWTVQNLIVNAQARRALQKQALDFYRENLSWEMIRSRFLEAVQSIEA